MENISYITLAKTGVTYAIDDSLAVHFSYLETQLAQVAEVLDDLTDRIEKLEYDVFHKGDNNSSVGSN